MIKRRQPTRQLTHAWPFLHSVDARRGLVLNVPAEPGEPRRRAVLRVTTGGQVVWPFSVKTQQQALLEQVGEAPF